MDAMLRKAPCFLALVFGLVLAVPVMGQTQETATTPEQAQQTPAGKFIQDLGNKAVAVIADKSLTPEQRSTKYGALLQEAFDIPSIGRFVIGRAWNTASPPQQQEYLKLFQSLVIKIYGDRLNFYSGESFHVNAVHQENEREVIVSSVIDHPGGAQPTSVDWRVHQVNGKFMIVDVVVEGVSQSVTQRQEYASILERNNGNFDALLNQMRQRLQQPKTAQ
jgi:phospholipid transport system substrate-binding protein